MYYKLKRGASPLGDSLGHLAVLFWLTIAVGPWWVGLGLFILITLVNSIEATLKPRKRGTP